MQNWKKTKLGINELPASSSESLEWEQFFNENTEFSDSDSDFMPEKMPKFAHAKSRSKMVSQRVTLPKCKEIKASHETVTALFSKGLTLSKRGTVNRKNCPATRNAFQKVAVFENSVVTKTREKLNKHSDTENIYAPIHKRRKTEILRDSINKLPNQSADSKIDTLENNESQVAITPLNLISKMQYDPLIVSNQKTSEGQMTTSNKKSFIAQETSASQITTSNSSKKATGIQMIVSSSTKLSSSQETFRSQMTSSSTDISISQETFNSQMSTSSREISSSQETISSIRESSQTMIISSQESSSGHTMIVSSQESIASQMITSSLENSVSQEMCISSQENNSSQKMSISSQENNGSQNMIISNLEHYRCQNIISSQESGGHEIPYASNESYLIRQTLSPNQENFPLNQLVTVSQEQGNNLELNISSQSYDCAKMISINDKQTLMNKIKSKNTCTKLYNCTQLRGTNKMKFTKQVSGTASDSGMCGQCKKEKTFCRGIKWGIRKRELLVVEREKTLKFREKLLAAREAEILKREKVIKLREQKCLKNKERLKNQLKKRNNATKNKVTEKFKDKV